MIGVLMDRDGRPEHVYSNYLQPALKDLRHEVTITDAVLSYDARADIIRDPKKVNQQLHPDFELIIGNHLFYGEVDMGTEAMKVVMEQQARYTELHSLLPDSTTDGKPCYRSVTGIENVFLLYVMTSETRLNNVRERSEQVKGIALFTTVEAVMSEPDGLIWRTTHGQCVRLPN